MKRFLVHFLSLFLLFSLFLSKENIFADNNKILYTSSSCLDCDELIDDIFNDKSIIIYDIDTDFGQKKYNEFIKDGKIIPVPILLINGEMITGYEEINKLYSNNNTSKVLLLGFLDGLNPCAISILLIFSSFLIILNKKKQLLFCGINFIIGETIVNFLLGFGLLKITEFISNYSLFIKIIYIITILAVIYVFILNCIDIYNGFNKKEEIKNQLDIKIKYKVTNILTKNLNSKFLIFIAFIMGGLIAILEFGCTGQLYLPTIMSMNFSIFYLILYNTMFALPLILFLVISLIISKPDNIREFIMKKSYILKIVLNIVILILMIQIFLRLI